MVCSQEVVGSASRHVWLASSRCGVKYEEIVVHLFVDFHDSGFVSASVAVIGRAKDGYYRLLVAPVVAGHDELVGSGHCFQPVLLDELVRYVLTKCISGSSW